MKKRIVIALGHSALGTNLPKQQEAVERTARAVCDFIAQDYQVLITHSNGPQVSMIHTAMNEFAMNHPGYTSTPMSVCSAMSQGYIGYDLQGAIRGELISRGIYKPVVTVLTQVSVDPYDEAFYRPSKKIGRVLSKEEADDEEKRGHHITEVEGGFRRVVATPKPEDIIEIDAIRSLLDTDNVVIACGGGGIPVLAQDNKLRGAAAVIEKDTAAAHLADQVGADLLIILTGTDKVKLCYGTDEEESVDFISVKDAKKYMQEGVFESGTMAPKIQAAIDFIGDSAIRKTIITKLDPDKSLVAGNMGTMIGK